MHYTQQHGSDWLRDASFPNGMFRRPQCGLTPKIIATAMHNLRPAPYSHPKLVAMMDFGFWRYMFAQHQYFYGGQTLLAIFVNKPRSTPAIQYDHNYVFNTLEAINNLRNRLAHHEPICFLQGEPIKDTQYARGKYHSICQLFQWMNIDEGNLLYGLDHVEIVCNKIDNLSP
jgi:hypothetical protein